MFEAAPVVPAAMAAKAFQSSGKIDGNSVAEPFRASSLRLDHLASDQNEPRKEIPKLITFAAARPPDGLKSPREWLEHLSEIISEKRTERRLFRDRS